jgi:hypothetical protein
VLSPFWFTDTATGLLIQSPAIRNRVYFLTINFHVAYLSALSLKNSFRLWSTRFNSKLFRLLRLGHYHRLLSLSWRRFRSETRNSAISDDIIELNIPCQVDGYVLTKLGLGPECYDPRILLTCKQVCTVARFLKTGEKNQLCDLCACWAKRRGIFAEIGKF